MLDKSPNRRLVLMGAVCVAAMVSVLNSDASGQGATQQIASLTPSVPRFGPTEAGKRSRDRIIVTVADVSGAPVLGARWRFKTDDRSGWVYPAQGTTGADGRISVTWVAGTPGAGVLTLTAENAVSSMTTELATESVASQRPPSGATAVWLHHGGRANGYSIDLTPLSEPSGTYYAAIQWDGGYTGLQRGGSRYDYQLQFSVWDAPGGGDAQVVERGDGVICRPFGGEGTGQACELNYPWRVGATYRFEVTEEDLNGGSAMTLHVTDLVEGSWRFVGTLRYAARANLQSFAMFVEDFVHRAPTCLAKDVRSAAIRRAMARVGDSWQSITSGTVGHYREDSQNPGTPACANRAARHHAAGLEMVFGGRTASDPDAPRSVTIPASANGRPVADTMTQFVPVVLSAYGKNDSFFTSELALTNRGSDAATLNFTYTGRDGVGSGSATDMLVPHQQKIAPDAIDYLSGLGIPMPEIANRVGTLRVGVSDSSDVSVVVRTTTPTAVPEGRAGLAYLGVPQDEGFHDEAVYLCGLQQNQKDRSNVALQNMGSEGSITLRTTVFSGNPADPAGKMLKDMVLGPGEFHQFGEVLKNAGKANPRFGGYVRVERVEGEAPFYAYGVINDNANSDGSFVFPVSAASLEGAMGQTLPALVEAGAFATELTLTNFSGQPKSVMFSVTHERIEAEDNTAGFGPVILPPGQQLIIPQALAHARQSLGLDVPMGLVAPLIASPASGDLSGVVIGARVVAQADAEDPSQGQYGVFYTAVPRGRGFTTSAWVDGLQQNQENRSNLALINTGEVDGSASVFELDVYDGETGMLVRTVTMAEEPLARVTAKGFRQINGILGKHAPGTTQGYIRIRKVSGANPFLAYGVVNDGGAPGERTGDGAYIPARE